ncbi:MAG: hypothetical protein VKP62_09880 [Candidatus Sericytochromatia bacterium]|nr:hypothetical protein [Candidatus Sericytochromatia bacterium]
MTLNDHLEPGESLVWSGAPPIAPFVGASGCFPIAALPFIVVGPLLMGWLGLLPVAFGLYAIAYPFLQWRRASRLVYGVTNRRVLIIRRGRPELVLAFGPAELGQVSEVPHDAKSLHLYFAVGPHAREVMPLRKRQGSVDVLGLMGVPREAADAVRAVAAQATRQREVGPLSSRAGVDHLFQAKGSLEACRVKIYSGVVQHFETVAQSARHQLRKKLLPVVLIASLALLLLGTLVKSPEPVIVLGVLGLPFISAAWFKGRHETAQRAAEQERFLQLAALLHHWRDDALKGAPCRVQLDLGSAIERMPYRWALSPASGTLKSYHRQRRARISWFTACGSKLVLECVDRIKFKARVEVQRRSQIRGVLELNPAVWAVDRLPDSFQAGPLKVNTHRQAARTSLSFQGPLSVVAETGSALQALYDALPRSGV